MKRTDFNRGWTCRSLTGEEPEYPVCLPHDAMRSEKRTSASLGEGNTGWYIGGDYEYRRSFTVTRQEMLWPMLIEFEGVYHNAEVFINGTKAAFRPYGYTNFYVDPTPYIFEGENEIRVIARNSDQPNSRWYSGTGLYRPVYLWSGGEDYIPVNGIRIRTVSISPAIIEIRIHTNHPGTVQAEIFEKNGSMCGARAASAEVQAVSGKGTGISSEEGQPAAAALLRMEIPGAKLWNTETPNLYVCRVTFGEDVVEETFGIRTLDWNEREGFTINGERVILRGACIHHDNGILGACSYPEAEERRVRILKKNGYNALRSAHNPCSKAMLEACDRLGMLMMDEYVDVWYIHKTKHDYVGYLADWWKADLKDMVDKDYNHPSVIMYSTGNEVSETAQKKGIELTGTFTKYLHEIDGTRPVTCGINIFFNFLSSVGLGVYSDDKAKKAAKEAEKNASGAEESRPKKKAVGSEFYNTLACLMGDYFMKCGATLYPCDVKTRGAFANMDIAGYNYGIFRYEHDLKKYPKRLILGSETFCKDAYLFYEKAKKHKRIIGDFVWAGMDYIGETGAGAAEYSDYKYEEPWTTMTGGNGRIDLLGKRRAEAAFTLVAFERETGPFIAVNPVYEKEKLQLTGWQLTKALESWSWRGCAGEMATVEVYARAASVELLLNDRSVGKKAAGRRKCRVVFRIPYEDGSLTAVSYDDNGAEIARQTLTTAGVETVLEVRSEEPEVHRGGLAFVQLRYTDKEGIWKPMEKHELTVRVENGSLEGLGSANPYVRGNYTNSTVETYFGEALAAVRADGSGSVRVSVSDGSQEVVCEIPLAAENCV